jgi:hypothetical protein
MVPSDCLSNTDACMKAFHSAADLWFGRLSLSTKVVAVGLILEAPELGYEIWAIVRRKIDQSKLHITYPECHAPDWVKVVAFVGWILSVGGVVGEWVSEGRVNEADTSIQELDDILVREATNKAGSAANSAQIAEDASKVAKRESSDASSIAKVARLEADSFEKDIVSAKTLAADAESHLADALKQAADATAELNRFKTPRSLIDVTKLVANLEQFKGTEYIFASVFQDEESMNLLREIDKVLKQGGWKRGKSVVPVGVPNVNIYGKDDPDFAVSIGFNTGIRVSVESPQPLKDRPISAYRSMSERRYCSTLVCRLASYPQTKRM